jgi:hypothetical protein
MKISREVKIADRNYGNSTNRLEFEIAAKDLIEASSLLATWEALLRLGIGKAVDVDEMTVKEARETEEANAQLTFILSRITELALVKESAQ